MSKTVIKIEAPTYIDTYKALLDLLLTFQCFRETIIATGVVFSDKGLHYSYTVDFPELPELPIGEGDKK